MTVGVSGDIYRELAGFCTFFLVGVALEGARALLCFGLAVFRRYRQLSNLFDLLYWIFACLFLIWELYGKNQGVLSSYIPLGIGCGVCAMWRGFTVRLIPPLSEFVRKVLISVKKRLKNRLQRAKIKMHIDKYPKE